MLQEYATVFIIGQRGEKATGVMFKFVTTVNRINEIVVERDRTNRRSDSVVI